MAACDSTSSRFRMARWSSCGIRKPRPRADGGQAPAGWPSAVMFRACVAEQSAVALDAEFKIGMRMAISYSAVQPRVLAKSGKARGGALSHRTCRRVIRRISQPYIRIRIPNRRSDSPDRPAAYSCSDHHLPPLNASSRHEWVYRTHTCTVAFAIAEFGIETEQRKRYRSRGSTKTMPITADDAADDPTARRETYEGR